ncbi:GNAT family N-acetyltransferase [Fodinicola feengrottensis]|uniref:GNAT family N-acetyltransferase n=1 Tax=Fodinicola feengrottensis TaxID=435914 RepID=A0ABN2I8D3_9ACTN|nr:GNAT family N-acetyltransferase [Fodinicola feengrottensis]
MTNTEQTDGIVLRPFQEDEFRTAVEFINSMFFEALHEEDVEEERTLLDLERTTLLADGDEIVGTAGIYTRRMTVPGAVVPTAAVTWVGVAPTHRRRGLLTRMMKHQLHGLHNAADGEPVAALWASETAIYGRFGYGMAIRRGFVEAQLRDIPIRPDLRPTGGQVRQLSPKAALPDLVSVYEQARPSRTGFLDRTDPWWQRKIHDPEYDRNGFTPVRAAVYSVDGRPEAYALYRVKESDTQVGPDSLLQVKELIGTSGAAELAIWEFITSLDLLRRVEWYNAPLDLPIRHAVVESRRIADRTSDSIWVRLVDVDRALAARTYSAAVDVVLDVTDTLCGWNADRWRLRAEPGKPATCERTQAPADLALSVTELGAAYLGGTSLATLAAAGRVTELRAGALREAAIAFLEPRPPFCNDGF